MNIAPVFIFVLPVLTVLAVGMLGRTRRLGFWLSIIVSILLTPVIGLLVVLISGPRRIKARPKAQSN